MIDDSWYKKIDGVKERTCSGGVVVRKNGTDILVALVKEGDLPEYVLPKGGVEEGETLEQAALREIGEESGLQGVKIITYLGKRERLTYHKSTWSTIHYFLCVTSQKEGMPTDHTNQYSLMWFPLDNLPLMLWPEQQKLIEDNKDEIKKFMREITL